MKITSIRPQNARRHYIVRFDIGTEVPVSEEELPFYRHFQRVVFERTVARFVHWGCETRPGLWKKLVRLFLEYGQKEQEREAA